MKEVKLSPALQKVEDKALANHKSICKMFPGRPTVQKLPPGFSPRELPRNKNKTNLRDIKKGQTIIDGGEEFLVLVVATALRKYKPYIIIQDKHSEIFELGGDDSEDDIYIEVL